MWRVPDGYLDRLEAMVIALAEEWWAFSAAATPAEIKAAEDSFSVISARGSDIRDHDMHNMMAGWAIEHVEPPAEKGAKPTVDIGGLWKMLEPVLDDILFYHGVDTAGTIYGFEKYENFDPDWLQYIINWLKHAPSFHNDREPGQAGVSIPMPDNATIAIVGDWGTGTDYQTQTAGLVGDAMAKSAPDFAVHLGDVYYAGKPKQQTDHFLAPWKHWVDQIDGGRRPVSLTLNSNHDRYDGDVGYVGTTLADSMFATQNGQGHFVLENSNFVVVGLDTAWPACWDDQFMFGDLHDGQLEFLTAQARTGKQLILLTHHQGRMEGSGEPNNPLHDKVVAAVKAGDGGAGGWYWYWGHIHAGYVYKDTDKPYRARCAGHGAIPWGNARELDGQPDIAWYETTPNTVGDHQVMNGFALLQLTGPNLTEQFRDQHNNVTWPK